jgi:hypothetical protein
MAQRLNIETWKNIFRNTQEANEEIEVVWLDSDNEYCLCVDCELFEDGFKTEKEAEERLEYLRNICR